MKTHDGREIRGVRRNEDTFSLQMVDSSGQLHLLDKTKLASVAVENTSLHPTGLRDTAVGDRDREPRRVPWRAAGTRLRKTAAAPPLPGGVTYERLLNPKAEPHNWLMYWGDYQGTHYLPAQADRHGQRGAGFAPRGRRRCRATR